MPALFAKWLHWWQETDGSEFLGGPSPALIYINGKPMATEPKSPQPVISPICVMLTDQEIKAAIDFSSGYPGCYYDAMAYAMQAAFIAKQGINA